MARGPTPTSNAWTAPAVIAAYLLPGMGHIIIGRPVRGIIVMVMVAATFWSGLAIGGVMTIDPQEQRWWFIGQMVTGVHGLYAWHRQAAVYKEALAEAYQDPDFKSMPAPQRMAPGQIDPYVAKHLAQRGIALVPPVDTPARAYTGVAGMLNLMCIFDVLMLGLLGVQGEQPVPHQGQSFVPHRPKRDEGSPA